MKLKLNSQTKRGVEPVKTFGIALLALFPAKIWDGRENQSRSNVCDECRQTSIDDPGPVEAVRGERADRASWRHWCLLVHRNDARNPIKSFSGCWSDDETDGRHGKCALFAGRSSRTVAVMSLFWARPAESRGQLWALISFFELGLMFENWFRREKQMT